MNLNDIRTGFAYNRWANELLLAAAGELSVEELNRDLKGSFQSIRGTLRHLFWGEMGWLHYWQEREFPDQFSELDFADLPSIVAGWKSLEEEKASFASELTEEKLLEPCPVDDKPYGLGELIQNILVPSIHQRVHGIRN